ncbi:MAG TPA: hypothetical protein VJ323_02315 [Bryobacteraceae bacterium]|jgi:hypothetical protein|nr:hypothetical protein [Bryobacteraceae bacterium]
MSNGESAKWEATQLLKKMEDGAKLSAWDIQSLIVTLGGQNVLPESNEQGNLVDPGAAALTLALLIVAHGV